MKSFHDQVSQILDKIILKEFGIKGELPFWEIPSRPEFGDLSSMAALKLAARLKKNPREIAEILKTRLEKKISGSINKIDILNPGFLNIYLSKETLIFGLNEILKKGGGFFKQKLKRKVLLEFVSANPTGPLSIAHGRQAVVGDTIGKILEFFSNSVTREYYINDDGRQIELLVESVQARIDEIEGRTFEIPEGGYLGEYVKDIARAALEKKPKDLEKFVLTYSVDLIKKELKRLGIEFDSWPSQKEIIRAGKVDAAIDFLKKKGFIYEKEGALWFASTKFKDDKDRVIKKTDNSLTYFASDIAFHRDKLKRKYDLLLNLWGPDHHGYIERVMAAIEALGFNRDILKVLIVQLVTIKTQERMSRRRGTAILLSDLIDEVGKDAARFYYLTRRNSSHLDFDIDLAKAASFDNPLYYIQYACARIESIFSKLEKPEAKLFTQHLGNENELALLRLLFQFSYAIEKAYYGLEPVFIIEYLKALSAGLHKFYEKERVLVDDKSRMNARRNLLEATRLVLHCGLGLLGITPAIKM